MNSIIKKLLLVGFALMLSACIHYPQRYSYYSGHDAYSGGYIMHRNHYGERPDRYDNAYGRGHVYFPHHRHHDQRGSGYEHRFNFGGRADGCQGWRKCRDH